MVVSGGVRWLDGGMRSPLELHAFYHGLAAAQAASERPLVVWVRSSATHISLGAHQDAALELTLDAEGRAGGLPVVRRETGGGTVVVDPGQWVYAFIVPRHWHRGPPQALFSALLPVVAATYKRLGLAVERRRLNDLWHGQQKVAGTGMATIGRAHVLVGSFMPRFPAADFAAAVRCPSEAFRGFLEQGLRSAVAGWADLAPEPHPASLRRAFRTALVRHWAGRLVPDRPSEAEEAAIDEARTDLTDPDWLWEPQGRRAVAGGVKLKGDAFLTEGRPNGFGRVTVWTEAGRIRGLDAPGLTREALRAVEGRPAEAGALAAILGTEWAEAVAAVAVTVDQDAQEGEDP